MSLRLAASFLSLLALPLLSAGNLVAADTLTDTAAPLPATRPAHNDGSRPEPKKEDRFTDAHKKFLERAAQGPVGLLFLGDSITANWTKAPQVWEKYYGPYQPANFGIGGDLTQNILWRIDNGELDHISPKVVVLMIGTNNSGSNTSEQITAAITKIITNLRQKLPNTKILLLSIFPRGSHLDHNGKFDDGSARMKVIHDVNASLPALDDGKNVRVLDIGKAFLVNGEVTDEIMADHLHPTAKGYQIWADAMQPLLQEMLKD